MSKRGNDRPEIRPTLTVGDKFIEWSAIGFNVTIWGYTLFVWQDLPESIPVHFNLKGEPDNFGNRYNLLILPLISGIIFAGLTILNRYPHMFNYPVKITAENALDQYTRATRLLRILKTEISMIFLYIQVTTIMISKNQAEKLPPWFLVVAVISINLTVFIYLISSLSGKTRKG